MHWSFLGYEKITGTTFFSRTSSLKIPVNFHMFSECRSLIDRTKSQFGHRIKARNRTPSRSPFKLSICKVLLHLKTFFLTLIELLSMSSDYQEIRVKYKLTGIQDYIISRAKLVFLKSFQMYYSKDTNTYSF